MAAGGLVEVIRVVVVELLLDDVLVIVVFLLLFLIALPLSILGRIWLRRGWCTRTSGMLLTVGCPCSQSKSSTERCGQSGCEDD